MYSVTYTTDMLDSDRHAYYAYYDPEVDEIYIDPTSPIPVHKLERHEVVHRNHYMLLCRLLQQPVPVWNSRPFRIVSELLARGAEYLA